MGRCSELQRACSVQRHSNPTNPALTKGNPSVVRWPPAQTPGSLGPLGVQETPISTEIGVDVIWSAFPCQAWFYVPCPSCLTILTPSSGGPCNCHSPISEVRKQTQRSFHDLCDSTQLIKHELRFEPREPGTRKENPLQCIRHTLSPTQAQPSPLPLHLTTQKCRDSYGRDKETHSENTQKPQS